MINHSRLVRALSEAGRGATCGPAGEGVRRWFCDGSAAWRAVERGGWAMPDEAPGLTPRLDELLALEALPAALTPWVHAADPAGRIGQRAVQASRLVESKDGTARILVAQRFLDVLENAADPRLSWSIVLGGGDRRPIAVVAYDHYDHPVMVAMGIVLRGRDGASQDPQDAILARARGDEMASAAA